jgi:membrane peptidoglycan carboxypeptidase
MLDSLPTGLAPQLKGFGMQGQTRGALSLLIDWSDFDLSELSSSVDMDGCRVVRAPEHMSAERLTGSFEQRVPVPGGWRSFVIGPQNPDFVPLNKVSSHLKRSFLTTEDSAFYRHQGFITKEFRGALVKNLKRGRFAYGASSISMQVVKNVLLSREKTVSRKFQELFLTWHMEQALSKDRILEIYVNAIEFGPGLYGIGPASRQYFAKDPRHLNPVESAFLASLLPAPTKRYKQYCGGYVRRSTSAKIERILGFMLKRHRLDEEQYAAALETPLSFRGRRSDLCKQSTDNSEGKNS